jgi:hypothetical protein
MASNNEKSGGSRNQGSRGNQGSGGKQASGSGSARNQGGGSMSVREAGHKGGQRVSELVEKGKQRE